MPSVGQVAGMAGMPASVALKLAGLSNPVTAAIAGGITLLQMVDKIGQGRKAANKFTQNGGPQDIINKQLAAISNSAATPEEKSQATDQAWRSFLEASQQFATANPKQATVVKKAIYNTPELTQTVQGLLGQNPLDEGYLSGANAGVTEGMGRPNPGPGWGGTIAKAGVAAATPFVMNKLQTGTWNQGRTVGDIANNPDWQGPTQPKPPGLGSRILTGVFGGGDAGQDGNGGGSLLSRILPGAISSGTSLLAGYLGSRASGRAAEVQADSADEAARLNFQAGREARQLNRDVMAQQQANMQPWLDAGASSLRTIGDITSDPNYSWNEQFTAPTEEQAMAKPGIQFQLKQGQRALEAYLRANGKLLSGKAIKEINEHAQGVASQGYDRMFDQSLQEYGTKYNTFANERTAKLNPHLAVAGLGQTSTAQLSNDLRQGVNADANIGMSTAQTVGDLGTQAGNARASGYAAGGNIWGNALANIGNNLTDNSTIQQLLRRMAA